MKTVKDVKHIVIAGAGTMGSSMGETFAKYGYDVTLYDVFPEALKKAENLIRLNQETEVAEHIVTAEESAALLKRRQIVLSACRYGSRSNFGKA